MAVDAKSFIQKRTQELSAKAAGSNKTIDQLSQETKSAKRKADFMGSPIGIALNTIGGIPKATVETGIDIAQSVARSAASVVSTAAQIGVSDPDLRVESLQADTTMFGGRLQQFVFGKQPIETLEERVRLFPERSEEFGIPESFSSKVAPLAIAAITFTDLFPPTGGGKSSFIKNIAKEQNPTKIAELLRGARIPDDSVESLARQLAPVTKEADVTRVIQESLDARTLAISRRAINTTARTRARGTVRDPVVKNGDVVEQVFRTDKLDLAPEGVVAIEQRLKALGLTTRGVRTFEDMQNAAQQLGLRNARELIKETATNRITDREVVALRSFISQRGDDIVKLEKEAIANPERADEIARQVGIVQQELDDALNKLVKGGTEAGRAVVAFRIRASKTLDPVYWLSQAKKQLKGKELNVEQTAAILNLIDQGDRQGLASFVSMLRKPPLLEQAITLWKAGLLTSPTTHMANILGNTTMAGLMTASDVASTGLDVLASLATGKRTTTIGYRTVTARVKGIGEGARSGVGFLKTGIYPEDIMSKYDVPRNVTFKNKYLQGYTQAIFRSLGAEDIVFRQSALSESFMKNAIVIAKNEKLSGKQAKERIRELLLQPSNEMIANAIDDAERATFQNANAVSEMVSRAKSVNPVGEAVIEFLAPFVRTPTNIAIAIADFSPFGLVRALTRFARPSTRSQKDLVERLGRGLTGTGMIAFGAYLHNKGLMTGNVPTSSSERADFYAEGKQPFALRVGENWVALNRVSPLGNVLALGAEFDQLGETKTGLKLVASTVGAGVKGLTDQTFLKGVSGGLKAVTEPEKGAEKFLEQSVASVVPSVIGRFGRTLDPTLRVPDNVYEAFVARIPVASQTIAPRVDIFGNEVRAPSGRLSLIDPFSVSTVKESPIIDEFKRHGLIIGLPSATISGERLNPHEYAVYQKIQGKVLEQTLQSVIDSPSYQQMQPSKQAKTLERARRSVREQVNDQVFPMLMMRRYGLDPKSTSPDILREVIKTLNENDQYKDASDSKKSAIITSILSEYQQ